jgi:hypothetical protein
MQQTFHATFARRAMFDRRSSVSRCSFTSNKAFIRPCRIWPAALAWLDPKAFAQRLMDELDAAPKPALALSNKAKADKLAMIAVNLAALEHEEEALIAQSEIERASPRQTAGCVAPRNLGSHRQRAKSRDRRRISSVVVVVCIFLLGGLVGLRLLESTVEMRVWYPSASWRGGHIIPGRMTRSHPSRGS